MNIVLITVFIALLLWAAYQYRYVYDNSSATYWSISTVLGWLLVLNTLIFIYQPAIYSPEYSNFLKESIKHHYAKSLLGAYLPLYLFVFSGLCLTFPSVLKYKISPLYGSMRQRVVGDCFFITLVLQQVWFDGYSEPRSG